MSHPQSSQSTWHTEGTGGRPNLLLISDYGPSPAEHYFELHTMIQVPSLDDIEELRALLPGEDTKEYKPEPFIQKVLDCGTLRADRGLVAEMLRAAFAVKAEADQSP